MDSSYFFSGRKHIDTFYKSYKKDRIRIYCVVYEKWINILTSGAKCGASEVYKVTRTLGVSESETEELSSAIKGSIGIEGVASLQSKIASMTKRTIAWNSSETIEQEFSFTAPKCAHYIASRYQLVREYEIKYEDDRWFRNQGWEMTVSERLNRFHDGSQIIENDPDCNCDDETEPFTGLVSTIGSKISAVFPFRAIGSDYHMVLPSGGNAIINPNGLKHFSMSLPKECFSPDLIFLADQILDEVVVEVQIARGAEDLEALDIRPHRAIIDLRSQNLEQSVDLDREWSFESLALPIVDVKLDFI